MPVFRSGKGLAPPWCEMEYFEIVKLPKGATHIFERISSKEKLVVGVGECLLMCNGETVSAKMGANLDLKTPHGHFAVLEVASDVTLIRMCGRWGSETGGSGIFGVVNSAHPHDGGDPVDYPKETNFDSHYHDCDEYWILFEGHGIAVSEGKKYAASEGDCIVTGMGHHHDFPQVFEPVKAVYFETTLEGQKRLGHLWNHRHGIAQPQPDKA